MLFKALPHLKFAIIINKLKRTRRLMRNKKQSDYQPTLYSAAVISNDHKDTGHHG
jgi:hypothetical protein